MSHGTVLLEAEGDLAIIILNRPEKRNALSPELIEDLLSAWRRGESGARTYWLCSREQAGLCAGMDLASLRKLADQTPAENLADARRTAGLFRRVWTSRSR